MSQLKSSILIKDGVLNIYDLSIPEVIRLLILLNGTTQAEFAKTLGVSYVALSHVLNGHSVLNINVCRTLCKIYGLDFNVMLYKIVNTTEEAL